MARKSESLRGKGQPYRERDTRKQHFHDYLPFSLACIIRQPCHSFCDGCHGMVFSPLGFSYARPPLPSALVRRSNCFIVRDANGQALSYVYYENEPGRRSAAKLLSEDEARRIAANIAKLPEFAQKKVFGAALGQDAPQRAKP
jgi:hypothetical protein